MENGKLVLVAEICLQRGGAVPDVGTWGQWADLVRDPAYRFSHCSQVLDSGSKPTSTPQRQCSSLLCFQRQKSQVWSLRRGRTVLLDLFAAAIETDCTPHGSLLGSTTEKCSWLTKGERSTRLSST